MNILSELDMLGVKYDPNSDDWVRVPCPFHDDESPSAAISMTTGYFRCHAAGCQHKTDFIAYLVKVSGHTRTSVIADLSTRYEMDLGKTVDPTVVEKYHKQIWSATWALEQLEKRGLTKDDIQIHRLGVQNQRITIPIYDSEGFVRNIRKYKPGAPGHEKMKNLRGHGSPPKLYPIDQLRYDKIMLCGGEVKAIAAIAQLNKHGIGAITATCGEGNWHASFNDKFVGKIIYVCLDIDDAGRAAAKKLALKLFPHVELLHIIDLPLDRDKYPTGDINDYVALKHDLFELIKTAVEWVPPINGQQDDEKPIESSLTAATHASMVGKRVKFAATVSAAEESSYSIPGKVKAECDFSQKHCDVCPLVVRERQDLKVPSENPAILDMMKASDKQIRVALMSAYKIPMSCKSIHFEIQEHYNVESVRLDPSLDVYNVSTERSMQEAAVIGVPLELNEAYNFTGRLFPHPRTQKSTLVLSEAERARDNLSTFTLGDTSDLVQFVPITWTLEALTEKLVHIYHELEMGVTRIHERLDMHILMDLTYHSTMLMNFQGRVTKAWVEVLVIGDSAQGKSELVKNLMDYYQLGQKVDCKNATVAGLLGGLQKIGDRFYVCWGAIPQQDRRLIVLEELKGASIEVISKLTDMRSSGFAEMPKIEKRKTHARTRIIAVSNPRRDQPLDTYSYGVQAAVELVGSLEDLRRFDAVYFASARDVQLNETYELIDCAYDSAACRRLILWAWSSGPAVFEDEDHLISQVKELTSKFVDDIPIVDKGSMKFKLARLSAACAARTFSEKDGVVYVRKCHVEFMTNYLLKIYSSTAAGYDSFSKFRQAATDMKNPELIEKRIRELPFPIDFIDELLEHDIIDQMLLSDLTGWDRGDVIELQSFLVRKRAMMRSGRKYRKTPAFINLLRKLKDTVSERPEHIEEERF